ncbi:hypothetical protein FKP32DRAFT_1549973, partial [Trametes sanguinea]
MSVSTARVGTTHGKIHERSKAILEAAREKARKARKYDFAATRETMSLECLKRTNLTPYPDQLDIAECMLLGLDATCIAGTGWGKTLPFALPLFVPESRNKIMIVVSPLNSLELTNTSLSSSVAVEEGQYSILLIFPKMLVSMQSPMRTLLCKPRFSQEVLGFVVDEAHCIAQWGLGGFRPEFLLWDVIRALLSMDAAVLITSATLPPATL